jgi:L-ascorbate metabolism protein UlaG (beta-lactamase superfamily)
MANLRGTKVTWLGHATALVETGGGTTILIDPFIEGNPSYPKGYTLPEKIDLLLLTHGHADHFSGAAPVATKYKPKVLGMFELVAWLQAHGVDGEQINGMNYGGTFRFQDLQISMVEAKHSSSIQDGKDFLYAGNPAGFMIRQENGPTLYHAGDTSLFRDMELLRELYRPEFGMLPIGDNYTMGPEHAALAAKWLGLKEVLPIHFGTFPALTGTPEALQKHLERSGIEVARVKPGETIR